MRLLSRAFLPTAAPFAMSRRRGEPHISGGPPARRPLVSLAVVLALGALLAPSVLAASDPPPLEGRWSGTIAVPGRPLAFEVDLRASGEGALEGDISIPAQGAFDVPLAGIAVRPDGVTFRITGVPGDPTFDGVVSASGADRIEGTFTQGGANLAFHMARAADAAAAATELLGGFDEMVENAMRAWNVPGLAIAIVSGGEVVYAKGFGWRDVEAKKPMTADTLFSIGSTTKAMTTTVLGMLVDEGKLAWDEPVRTYLPAFRLADPMISERITPRDLVTHRSGLPRHDLLWYNYNDGTRADMVARLAHLELTADLRERFQYNNLMYLTAGHLMESLTGKSWEENLRDRLFAPLGMERSCFSVLDAQRDADHALPYRENDDTGELERIPFRRIDLIGPAGSVSSSVNEMTRWLLFNLRRGRAGERQLVQAATLADIHLPQMTVPGAPSRADISQPTYGMGWMIDTYRGHRRLQHGGGIDGFITSVTLFPDDDVGIVAFNNSMAGLPGLLAQHAADRLLGLEPVDWNGDALAQRERLRRAADAGEAAKEKERRPNAPPSHPLAEYPGTYEHPGYGVLRIDAAEGDRLRVRINGITAPLEHWHYDVWSGADAGSGDPTFEDTRFLFRTDFDGYVAAVEATLEPAASPIVFERRPDARLLDPQYLATLTGEYTFAITGQKVTIELRGNELVATVPGQPRFTLEPGLDGRFRLVEAPMIRVAFETDDEGNVKVVYYQPQGVFEATRTPPAN